MEKLKIRNFCFACGKRPVAKYNRPHSLHKTKTKHLPNTQKVRGLNVYICTRCLRTNSSKTV